MDPYEKLFTEYIAELRTAKAAAENWWEQVVAAESERTGTRDSGEHAVRLRWPLGPTSYPRVIAVFRKYYLAVDSVNQDLEEELDNELKLEGSPLDDSLWGKRDEEEEDFDRLEYPRTVLFERLEEVDTVLARFMDSLVFIPVGLDPDGRVV